MAIVKVGMIGAGGISRSHLPGWQALDAEIGVEVRVYSDQGAAQLVAEVGFGSECATLEELLDWCDIVDIVTPTYTHAELATRALNAGKDVICEKPMALGEADAAALVTLAEQSGRKLFPAHVVRYFPQYVAARRAVQEGAIGAVAVSRFERVGNFPAWAEWFADDELSGGVIMDLMIHDLDIARWICGEVTQVYATVNRLTDTEGRPQATAQVVLTHVSGAISYVDGVWGPPQTSFCSSFHLSGAGGVIHYDSRSDQTITFEVAADPAAGGGVMLPDMSTMESPYLSEIRDFVSAITRGTPTEVTARDGLMAVTLAEAAITSARTGEPVSLTATAGKDL